MTMMCGEKCIDHIRSFQLDGYKWLLIHWSRLIGGIVLKPLVIMILVVSNLQVLQHRLNGAESHLCVYITE